MSLPPLPKNSELEKALGCSVVHCKDALKYGQSCREQALEEAAKVCDSLGGDINYNNPDETRLCANSLAHAIRSLKS